MPKDNSKVPPCMTISYNWVSEYIPVAVEPERLSKILTSIGLEVESMTQFQYPAGGLKGLVVGEVKDCVPHPGADKLKITTVDVGAPQLLRIVCGANNVAAGQKVVVARAGTTIYPKKGEPVTMKVARIRGEESEGMICAEDEIGLGDAHDGILVLPGNLRPGTPVSSHFRVYTDWTYEIGLTPNRMDAMSHFGVARDVCAYLSHHDRGDIRVKHPTVNGIKAAGTPAFTVEIENTTACARYSGISIAGITVGPSPQWLQDKLRAIGQRPINNIVDITNYILHDTGQPLHAFDADKINGKKIIVKNLPAGTPFKTLDGKERKLGAADLMICDGSSKGLCIAGVFGGADSGVTENTSKIFLESAWFNPMDIRKTSFAHGLRTDAAARFEKTVDISNTLNVLKRAAKMIADVAGGEIASEPVDVYPVPGEKKEVILKYHFLKKLSGKNYHPDTVKKILQGLGFTVHREGIDDIMVEVPFSKPDITLQADIVEEIMRIDGYDNIVIPTSITISPSTGAANPNHARTEKAAAFLTGAGFNEIFTNSITNAAYFDDEQLNTGVKLLNNLSAVHNMLRPSMLETGLETVAYNLNRRNTDLRLFEFGKTYHSEKPGEYREAEHLCLYVTGNTSSGSWKTKPEPSDIYYTRGMVDAVLDVCGITNRHWEVGDHPRFSAVLRAMSGREIVAETGVVGKKELGRFDIRQDVYFADIRWDLVQHQARGSQIVYAPLPNQLPVHRDLALVVDREVAYQSVESTIGKIRIPRLESVKLFDVFESEKLGKGRKSFAISLTFLDREKTLTDKEVDSMMQRIMRALEDDLKAEIRKGN